MNYKKGKRLSELALSLANQRGVAVAVSITDSHGELVTYDKMDGVSHHAAYLSQCKAYTASREKLTSSQVGEYARKTNRDMANWCDNKITGIAGGIPVFLGELQIGAIGIAGLPETEDEDFAKIVLEKFQ